MSPVDPWTALAVALCTLVAAISGAVAAITAAVRSIKTGKVVEKVRTEINGRMDDALAAADRAGYLRGAADERTRWHPPT